MGNGRADETGPSLARDVKEASAGNGLAKSRVPTFMKRSEQFLSLPKIYRKEYPRIDFFKKSINRVQELAKLVGFEYLH